MDLNRISVEEFKNAEKLPLTIVLDNVRSLYNVGSIFRTADAFLVNGIYLCGITARPPHREIHKTALGATDSVDWKYFKSTLEAVRDLKDRGCQIFAVEQCEKGKRLDQIKLESHTQYGLIFGNEVDGVEASLLKEVNDCIEIPQQGTKHSLNISVSVGVLLWDFYLKLKT